VAVVRDDELVRDLVADGLAGAAPPQHVETLLPVEWTNLREPQNWPWGDRVAGFHNPADNRWWVATCLSGSDGEP
jgi:hypothetical protein